MSALLQELATKGVTSEDIEKAAAARLFEKTAAAEGIDLNSMDGTQQDQLFDHFVENVLPGMVSGEKAASADPTEEEFVAAVMAKVASLDDDTKIALFERQAAYEQLALEDLDGENLKVAYAHFCESLLPTMVAQDGAVVEIDGIDKTAEADKVAEAQAKLAEAEILGRHMARAFADEQNKLAGAGDAIKGGLGRAKALLSGSTLKEMANVPGHEFKGVMHHALEGGPGKGVATEAQKVLAARGMAGVAGLGALGTGAYGAKKIFGGKGKESTASAPILEELAMQKAAEILEINGIDPTTGAAKEASIEEIVDYRARELLQAAGY